MLEAYPTGIGVIYEHEVKDGSIVIFQQNGLKEASLSFDYVKKDFFGNYKATYNGTVDMEAMFENYGFAYMVMMNEVAIEQWDLASPSIIGLIENEDIAKVLLTNNSGTFVQEAEIIRIGEKQPILFADLSNYQKEENNIIITAYNNNGEVVSSVQE